MFAQSTYVGFSSSALSLSLSVCFLWCNLILLETCFPVWNEEELRNFFSGKFWSHRSSISLEFVVWSVLIYNGKAFTLNLTKSDFRVDKLVQSILIFVLLVSEILLLHFLCILLAWWYICFLPCSCSVGCFRKHKGTVPFRYCSGLPAGYFDSVKQVCKCNL